MDVRETAAWPSPCPFFEVDALSQSVQKFEMKFVQGFFPPHPHPHCLPNICHSVSSVPAVIYPDVLHCVLCHLSWCPRFFLNSAMVNQLFFRLACCPVCSLHRPFWCPACSVISPGLPSGLRSVLVSCLFYHLSWYPVYSITCPGVLNIPSITCPGILLVFHLL